MHLSPTAPCRNLTLLLGRLVALYCNSPFSNCSLQSLENASLLICKVRLYTVCSAPLPLAARPHGIKCRIDSGFRNSLFTPFTTWVGCVDTIRAARFCGTETLLDLSCCCISGMKTAKHGIDCSVPKSCTQSARRKESTYIFKIRFMVIQHSL